MLAAVAFVAAGCVNEEPPYKEEPKPTPGDATGFLSVSGLSMRVVYDETDVRPDDTSDQTQNRRPYQEPAPNNRTWTVLP